MAMSGLSVVCSLVTLVCSIIILVDAFKNEWWKGLLCLFCPFYILYYAFAEFQSDKKNVILGVWLGAIVLSYGFMFAGMQHGLTASSSMHTTP